MTEPVPVAQMRTGPRTVPAPVEAGDWSVWPAPSDGTAWPTTSPDEAPVVWRTEGVIAVLTAAYSVLLGGVVGLIWPRVAPHIQIARAVNGSEAATKALLDDDMWLGLLGVAAGVVCVAIVTVMARDAAGGPGATVGLTAGGVLGSLVAAQIGHVVAQPHIVASLYSAFPKIPASSTRLILGYFGWTVRAKAVLLAWPIAAVVLNTAVVFVRGRRR